MLRDRQILVLEDEPFHRKSIVAFLESQKAVAWPASTIAEARELVSSMELDFALIDVNLPDGNSLELLRSSAFSPNTHVVVMTAEGGVKTAVEAMRLGAADYLSKPFDVQELPMVFGRILKQSASTRIRQFTQAESANDPTKNLFFGDRLKAIQTQLDRIIQAENRLSDNFPPVLIEGETGTGKSSLARFLHASGPRADAPFVEINCSTLPETLAESELFGHEKGAFTDARKDRIGLFEAASGGTLFLDEIASLSPALQAKVLTAVEDHRIRRVGSNRSISIDMRLIAASLHPLNDLVKNGAFREDLYHRLNLLHIQIPPIRDFPADLPRLANHLLNLIKVRYRLPDIRLSNNSCDKLSAYSWPGNVRELSHEMEKAVIFSNSGELDLLLSVQETDRVSPIAETHSELLNSHFQLPDDGFDLEKELSTMTRFLIDQALEKTQGNVSASARILGVPRDYVRYRLPENQSSD